MTLFKEYATYRRAYTYKVGYNNRDENRDTLHNFVVQSCDSIPEVVPGIVRVD